MAADTVVDTTTECSASNSTNDCLTLEKDDPSYSRRYNLSTQCTDGFFFS